jgi:hypothetical protein
MVMSIKTSSSELATSYAATSPHSAAFVPPLSAHRCRRQSTFWLFTAFSEAPTGPVHCIEGTDFQDRVVECTSDVGHRQFAAYLDRPTGSSAPENMSLRERGDGGPLADRHRLKKPQPRVLQWPALSFGRCGDANTHSCSRWSA